MQINKALVVYNKPLYQLHILEEKDPYYLKLMRVKHPTTRSWKQVYDSHHATLEGVQRTLHLMGIRTDLQYRRDLKKVGAYDLVVTVGGDGTLLETSHLIGKQTLLGVNAAPFDSTGALCRARLDNFLTLLVDLISGDLKPKKIPRLKIKIEGKVVPEPALNEALFANSSPAGTSRYLIQLGKRSEEHKSSGIWIASGTGSTAAIRSAGGKRVSPEKTSIQFAVREIFPEKGRKFKILRGILPKGSRLVLFSKMRQGSVFIDGNHIVHPVGFGQKVEITPDAAPLNAVF